MIQLAKKFQQGINWNAFFYAFYKISSTILTFALFHYLNTKDFSTWANINSIIFLTLLWIDCGFRKSIPRYCPEFAKNRQSHQQFISSIIRFQILLLTLTLPLFILSLNYIANTTTMLLIFAGVTFFIEGLISITRLIFHAHFWNKQFNITSTVIMLLEMITSGIITIYVKTSAIILPGIFIAKIIAGTSTLIISMYLFKKLYLYNSYPQGKTIDQRLQRREFIIHSGFMWLNNNLKSLTERNFLVPIVTTTYGPAQANIFKVIHDGALLFHRIIVKTIGTTDTALLAHIEVSPEKENLMPLAFQKVAKQIAAICLPFLGILLLLFLLTNTAMRDINVFRYFFIITISYFIESLLSPYERVLEVKRCYSSLFKAYVPYIIMLTIFFIYPIMSLIGLLPFLLVIHIVRLVSSFLMVQRARKMFGVQFPLQFAFTITVLCLFMSFGVYGFCVMASLGSFVIEIMQKWLHVIPHAG